VLPSRTINSTIIRERWDDILRFMVTIKLKETSASCLFKRLSSYAKDHPLYRAIKEFGRIIKTQFILTYIDDVELRQHIEKQLNRVELSNKFSKAVFFDRNCEFTVATREEQEIVTACKTLIQNSIILWNYLYLSQLLISTKKAKDKSALLGTIKNGSLITWQHVNMRGEYDFTKAANHAKFDMVKILALKIGSDTVSTGQT
jgi:TnpA family transposase